MGAISSSCIRALPFEWKRSYCYAHWIPLNMLKEYRPIPNENFFQLCVVSICLTCNIERPVRTELLWKWPNKLISRNSTLRWPPRSSDLTTAGYWKQEVYRTIPTNLDEFKQWIRATIEVVLTANLHDMNDFIIRCRMRRRAWGRLNAIFYFKINKDKTIFIYDLKNSRFSNINQQLCI